MSEQDFSGYKLGEDGEERAVDSLEGVQSATWTLANQARLSIDVIDRDLSPRLYDQAEFLDAVKALATSHRKARIRVLLHDVSAAVSRDHRLITMAQRLSTYVEIRRIGADFKEYNKGLFIVDEKAYVYRTLADRFEGVVSFNQAMRARELTREFDDIWEHSDVDPNFRRLHI